MKQGLFLLVIILALVPSTILSVNVDDTRLLRDPAISSTHIAFLYDSDLWVANVDGTGSRRLTTARGEESNPIFSPDGSLIAFNGNYDGNTDVYMIPVAGGVPQRLTWHPSADAVQAFVPDGSAVMFRSGRQVFTNRYTQLFTVSIDGGFPERLPIPNAFKATYSPDGSHIAYTPISERFNQWKNYRGGTVSRIFLYDASDHSVVQIAQPEGRSNETDPMWIGDTVYFLSDRNGEFNLFSFDVGSQRIDQLTDHTDFPILSASHDGVRIIYEQAGYLHVFDPDAGATQRLRVGVAAELRETRPRFASGARFIRNTDISPSGARAVMEFRGEIISVPAAKGDPRNLTETSAAHERSPVWSPDGRQIAYFSDESGEYQLHVRSQDGKGEVRQFSLGGSGFYETPSWSPDSSKIAFMDNSLSYYYLDLDSEEVTKFGEEYLYGPGRGRSQRFSWSPDSEWITYTLDSETYIRTVHVYSLDEDKSYAVTDGLSDVNEPVFDATGKYLYFFGSTDAGPVRQWFDQSVIDMDMTSSIYLAVLRDDLPSPLVRESDEENGDTEESEDDEQIDDTPFRIDFEGLDQRIIAVPLPARDYASLQAGNTGEIYFLERPAFSDGPGSTLKRYDLAKREAESLGAGVRSYILSADNKKLFYRSGNNWSIADAGKIDGQEGRLNIDDLQVRIDPKAEWEQIFLEAWRINRDYFYATNYHGVDWNAMHDKYGSFLDDLATRSDLNRVIRWMSSELAVGHHRVGGGDRLEQPDSLPGGLLGADYVIANGRYRFEKIYGGLNWNPDMRSPLTEPGVGVKEGEYLLAVKNRDLRAPTNLYSLFENTAEKIIEITVGPNPDGSDSRTVSVVPIRNESALRNRDWVEGNLRKVTEATDGRVAYVYVPNTSTSGHEYFKRYFFPQAHKDAIIIDERFNGGGSIADYYIDHLRRDEISYWNMRYGADLKSPNASIQGPQVMIIDETAGSGGDLLPWMFRKFEMGTLVGKRTWGGLVGTLGFPILMDGGSVTAPNLAIWTEDGWVVENVGVPPDIEVEQWPADVIAGRDPQLEKAIEVILEELERNPPQKPVRPPYPVRNPRGGGGGN